MNVKVKKRLIKIIWGVALFPFVFLFLMIFLITLGVFGKMPTFEDLENPQSELATEIYSDEGNGNYELLGKYYLKNRTHVEYKDLSQELVKALIATEDARFAKHSGIDFRSLGRVAVKTVLRGDSKFGGGSTITQQLALNLFSDRSSNKIKRAIQKLQEWVTAVKLERNYTKSEIITMYFNTVAFGFETFGIATASKTFFNKLPSELTLEESALMVGMVNAPTLYNPARNPKSSLVRRNIVIGQMKKYGYITKQVCDSAEKIPIKLDVKRMDHNTGQATYFREMLKQTMNMKKPDFKNYKFKTYNDFVADSIQWEKNPLYGWCNKNLVNGRPYNINRDGLKIYTTVNSKMQQYAEEAVEEHLSTVLQPQFDLQKKTRKRFPFSNLVGAADVNESIEKGMRNSDRWRTMKKAGFSDSEIKKSFSDSTRMTIFSWKNANHEADTVMTPIDSIYYYKSILRVAFMAMEPTTGKVKAYVGGPDFKFFKFDNTWQGRRQVGSTIKPFLYTLAFNEGMTPCYKVINNPQIVMLDDGRKWEPASSDKADYIGKEITLKFALAISSNNISAWLIQRITPHALAEMCLRFGITSFLDPQPALALGAADASLFEMVSAYNVYPSKGIHIYPYLVSHIEDKYGNRLASFVPDKEEVVSEDMAYLTVNLMQGVTTRGTGARVRNYLPSSEIGGKTGTTNKNSDGWFIGYVPKLTAGVWVGNEDRGSYLLGDGARMSLPIWGLFMKKVTGNKDLNIRTTDKFEIPTGVDMSSLNCADDITDPEEEGEDYEKIFF